MNPEVLPTVKVDNIRWHLNGSKSMEIYLKDGDTFDLPDGWGFEEIGLNATGNSNCGEEFVERSAIRLLPEKPVDCNVPDHVKNAIDNFEKASEECSKRLMVNSEKPVQKEESHIDLWKEGEEFYNKSYSGTEMSEFLKPYIINSYIAGKRSVTIKRKDS